MTAGPAAREALRRATPRDADESLLAATAPGSHAFLLWGGVAFSCVGGGYTLVFAALRAPWQILAGAGGLASAGIVLLLARVWARSRLRGLLRYGVTCEGSVAEVSQAKGMITYRFMAPDGSTRDGTLRCADMSNVRVGHPVLVCVDADHPSRHVALLVE